MHLLHRVQALALLVVSLVLVSCSGGEGWEEACASVDCGPGRCVYDGRQPACLCDEGFSAQGLTCAAELDDPCAPNPCVEQGRTRCVAEGEQARCECDEGRVDVKGACVDAAACNPNPCTAPFQTVCIPEGGTYTCVCDPGHEPTESGCNPISTFDCSVRHASGNPDAFEPDECPDNAQQLVPDGVPVTGHSISPAGDVDWYRILPQPGHIYEVVVSASSNFQLYGDAFDSNAATPLGSDHRGGTRLSMRFKARGRAPVFARIRALKGTASGTYLVSLFDRGVDDYADDLETALEFQAGSELGGAIQFDQDVDVFAFAVQPGTQHAFSVRSAEGEVSVELLDGAGMLKQSHRGTDMEFTWRANQDKAFLRIRSASPGALVGYEILNDSMGPDDHGDSPADATAVAPGPNTVAMTLERAGDQDLLSFEVTAGNVYAVTCTPRPNGQGDALVALLDESGTVLSSDNVYSYATYVAAEAPATGRLYLRLGWYYSSDAVMASFGCKVEDLGPEDHGDTWATATPVSVGIGGGFGRLEVRGDADVFSFTAAANHVYRFNCTVSSSDCNVRFLSAGGTQVGTGNTFEVGPTGATLFVQVTSSYSFGPGVSYSYSLEDLGLDDHGDSVFAATAITVGASPGSAVLESPQDKDTFSFTATANHIYRFSCSLVGGATGSCGLKIFGPTGAVLATTDTFSSSNGLTTLAWELPTTDTYFVEVSLASYSTGFAHYAFSLVDLGVDDHGDDSASATPISVGSSGTGTLEFKGDVDAYAFAATGGHVYKFTCARGTVTECAFRLKDATGTVLTSVSGSSSTSTVSTSWEATADATLIVELGTGSYYDRHEGTYSWTLGDVGTDDHGDLPSTATPVTLPMSTGQGMLESVGDVDAFAFTAVAGHIYRASCIRPLSNDDCRVRVKDPTGSEVGNSYGFASTAAFVTPTAGTWTVEVFTPYSGNAAFGPYTYLIEDLGVDDHGDSPLAATIVQVGDSTSGNIQYSSDADVFTFTAVPGHLYVATCTGQQPGGLQSCEVATLQPNGVVRATEHGQIGWKASTGAQYVRVSPYSSSSSGAYTLTITDVGLDDHGDSHQTATAIPLTGSPVSGVLEIASDVDFFSVSLSAGSHTATLSASSYAELTVYSTHGSSVLGRGSGSVTFTAPTVGTYYMTVNDWAERAAGVTYSLRVQ